MEIRLREITRGGGTTYAHVVVTGTDTQELDTYAVAKDPSGKLLACRTYALDDLDGFVVFIQKVDVDITVSFNVLKGDAVLASTYLYIQADSARKQSRKNTILRNKVTERIRGSEKEAEDRVKIRLEYAFDYPDGSDLIRGELFYTTMNEAQAKAELAIDVLDFNGNPANPGSCIILGNRCDAHPDAPNLFERKTAFALHVPHNIPRFTLWVHADEHALDTFVLVEAPELQTMKDHTKMVARSAEQNADYERWFKEEHRAKEIVLDAQRKLVWEDPVVFSVIVPLFHTPTEFFTEMADSVLGQTYPHLELVCVNATPQDGELARIVAQYQAADERVRVVELEENLGITENTNAGIAAAQGDFIAFFDHDDVLEPDILHRYARAIQNDPSIGLLYCDEDKLRDGHYESVLFKPDWNLDLLCSNNYVCHMLTVRKSIIDALEPATSEYDGAQDHHMTLRVAETGCTVHHERQVLYHWRMHEGSTAAASDAKSYTSDAGIRAVKGHFERIGIDVDVTEGTVPNTYQVRYAIKDEPLVSIVIATKDSVDLLKQCIDSILEKSTYGNYEIIIAENNSTEPETFEYYERVTADPRVKMTVCDTQGKVSVSSVYNQGAAAGSGDYIILLNNDTKVITGDWIERLLGPCQREDVGAVGPKLLYPDGVIQHAGVLVRQMDKVLGFFEGPDNIGRGTVLYDSSNYYNFYNLTQDISVVTGACLLTKRSIYEEIGGFDELLPNDYDDIDYCLKLREKGLLVIYEPSAVLYHYESVSRPNHTRGSQLIDFVYANGVIMQRYPEYYADCDPYFGPYLRNNRRDMQR